MSSNRMQGVIARVLEKEWNGKTLYSFSLRGQDPLFGLGDRKPSVVKEGASVQFDVEQKGKYLNAKNVTPWASDEVQSDVPASRVAKSTPTRATSQAGYWEARELRDIETQKRIELQSCRNSAVEFVKNLISLEAVKMPGKQADKAKTVEELVAHYTQLFLDENKNGKPGVTEAVDKKNEDSAEPDYSKKKEDTKNDDSAEWA